MTGMPTPPQLGPQAPRPFAQPPLPPFIPLRPMAQLSPLRPPLGTTVAARPPVTSEAPIPKIPTSFQSPTPVFVSTPLVTILMTKTDPLTAFGSSHLEANFSEIIGTPTPPVTGLFSQATILDEVRRAQQQLSCQLDTRPSASFS